MELSIQTTRADDLASISVVGEVDVSNASLLRDEIDAVLADGVTQVEVDLSQVSYIDSTGIGVLVGAAHRAADGEASLAVVQPQRNVARVLALLGVDSELNVRAGDEA